MGVISDILPEIALVAGQAITRGGPRRQYKWNKKAAEDANRMNRENQEWLYEKNLRLQQEQRVYDSAASQMQRYKDAGLNPHLIYGSGGGAGGAFPMDAGNMPGVNIAPPSAAYPDISGSFLSAGQTLAQTELANARVNESEANTALKQIQLDIAKTNPMLSPGVAQWVSASMMDAARLKSFESRRWMDRYGDHNATRIEQRIEMEMEAMSQRLGLNSADLSIKNKILESKDFENAVKEIQAKWLKDAEVSPEHIRQGLMLLLTKMLGK